MYSQMFSESTIKSWAIQVQTTAALAYTTFAIVLVIIWQLGHRSVKAPRIGKNPWTYGLARSRAYFMKNGRRLTEEGYKKYRDSMFVVQTADMERLILSNKYIDELRSLPEDHLSSKDAQCERHLASYTTMDVVKQSDLHADVCRAPLSHNLASLTASLFDETRFALEEIALVKCNSDTEEYTFAPTYPLMMDILNRIMSRALVGYPTCRDEEWLSTSIGYTMSAFSISRALRDQFSFLRPVIYYFLEARKEVHQHLSAANRLLLPLLKSRDSTKGNVDFLQWLVDGASGRDKEDPSRLAHKALFIGLAATNASNMGVVNVIFDLCAMPKYIEPLREEINESVSQAGGWTMAAMQNMKKLDSFLKESQRLNHPGLFSFNRKVLKPITLSDGVVLTKGTFIAMPTYFIARDPRNYTDADQFLPWRFYEKRESDPKNSNSYQFSATSRVNLAFGYGQSACPGRFFSALQMKLLLAYLILRYDMKFPDGQTERPESTFADERIMPSRTQMIGFRLRKNVDASEIGSFPVN